MPQLDFNVAMINFIFFIFFFFLFFSFFYFLIFQKLFKIVFLKKFFFESLENKKYISQNKKNYWLNLNFLELKKIFIFIKNIN